MSGYSGYGYGLGSYTSYITYGGGSEYDTTYRGVGQYDHTSNYTSYYGSTNNYTDADYNGGTGGVVNDSYTHSTYNSSYGASYYESKSLYAQSGGYDAFNVNGAQGSMYTSYANVDYGYSNSTSSYGIGSYGGEYLSQNYSFYGPSGGGSYAYSTYNSFDSGYFSFKY